ncbi:hypothetical protein K7X08_011659 [Anisodus acutangulus]|uniref:Phospholipase-like protein n=1 Tax=Anisodus acutangulus TaxID=402998 RepID=A0A9Q1RIR7_9SOLA|nr:hypothetical protein K7X08_011659 [Anisodus acutangulus]
MHADRSWFASGEILISTPSQKSPPNDPTELWEDDPKHKVDDVFLETDTILKESEHGDAMKQQRSTDSRTTSPPENLGFINAAEKELDPEAPQVSKKRHWKPNFLNKPDEGYDHAWLSGERTSKGRILLKACWKYTKKRSSCSPKCAISTGLNSSSAEEKTPIMTSITRRQKEKNDKIGQNDGAQFSSISARDSSGGITKKNVSQPTLVSSEEIAVLEALQEKHEKDDKKNLPAIYRDKRRRSSVEESGPEALGSVFSITKERNFANTYKEQCKRKNSPSQKEALGSVSNTKESNFLNTYEEQQKRKSSPSQKEALDPVPITKQSNFPETSKKQRKRKNYLSQEKVIYEDGDQEMLNLTKERWELVEHDYASVHALNVDDDVPVLTPGTESKKIVCSEEKLSKGKATDDPTPPSTMTMQQNLTPKEVHQNKRTNVEASESGLEGNPMSWTTPIEVSPEDGDVCSEMVHVRGYKVKVSSAPIVDAIFAKYGDITVNCHFKSPTVRASLLDVVCDVVRRLKTSDFNSSSIKEMKSVVSDVVNAKLDVSWLKQYLDEIFKEEDMEEKFSYLMALSETTKLVSKATKKDFVEWNREILAAEKQLKKAERRMQEAQSRAGEAKRSVNVFDVLGKKVQQDIKEVEDQARYWLSRLNELL